MIDLTVPETGQQPRALVIEAYRDLFDDVIELAAPGAVPPQLDPSIQLARAAQERDDVEELCVQLRKVSVAALASLVRVRAAIDPRMTGGDDHADG